MATAGESIFNFSQTNLAICFVNLCAWLWNATNWIFGIIRLYSKFYSIYGSRVYFHKTSPLDQPPKSTAHELPESKPCIKVPHGSALIESGYVPVGALATSPASPSFIFWGVHWFRTDSNTVVAIIWIYEMIDSNQNWAVFPRLANLSAWAGTLISIHTPRSSRPHQKFSASCWKQLFQ